MRAPLIGMASGQDEVRPSQPPRPPFVLPRSCALSLRLWCSLMERHRAGTRKASRAGVAKGTETGARVALPSTAAAVAMRAVMRMAGGATMPAMRRGMRTASGTPLTSWRYRDSASLPRCHAAPMPFAAQRPARVPFDFNMAVRRWSRHEPAAALWSGDCALRAAGTSPLAQRLCSIEPLQPRRWRRAIRRIHTATSRSGCTLPPHPHIRLPVHAPGWASARHVGWSSPARRPPCSRPRGGWGPIACRGRGQLRPLSAWRLERFFSPAHSAVFPCKFQCCRTVSATWRAASWRLPHPSFTSRPGCTRFGDGTAAEQGR